MPDGHGIIFFFSFLLPSQQSAVMKKLHTVAVASDLNLAEMNKGDI